MTPVSARFATRNARSNAARSAVDPASSFLPISASETPSCAASAATTSSASRASRASGVSAAAREDAAAAARARESAAERSSPPTKRFVESVSRARFPARRPDELYDPLRDAQEQRWRKADWRAMQKRAKQYARMQDSMDDEE